MVVECDLVLAVIHEQVEQTVVLLICVLVDLGLLFLRLWGITTLVLWKLLSIICCVIDALG